ncbi:hypothetical protein ABPG74_019056 [Tetrahymena malaccensis]
MSDLQAIQMSLMQVESFQSKRENQSASYDRRNFATNNFISYTGENSVQSSKIIQISNPIELTWKNLNIEAFIKKSVKSLNGKKETVIEKKQILKNLSGTLRPGQFTAILGPSGSGKTTLLNFLSGRLVAKNMEISGSLLLNNQEISDIDDFSNQIAYVMQDDILLSSFTPFQAFKFSADLRLKDVNEQQKLQRVNSLIKDLCLSKCQDTRIGDSMFRGISGGERKRTSIGVELLTNPAMLFLDEPTTGLDSYTALQVIELLENLSNKGVNVISTIHQPSSEIFNAFERLILICRGSIIYQGDSHKALDYFSALGYKCPDYSNPSEYFMKLMDKEGLLIEFIEKGELEINEEEIKTQFENRIQFFVNSYKISDQVQALQPSCLYQPLQKNDINFNVTTQQQFILLLKRSFISQIYNPMDLLVKSVQMIIFAISTIIVFHPLGINQSGIQDRSGALFFITTIIALTSISGSVATFSAERHLFLRERFNKSYGVGPYFWGKNLAEFPFHILYPFLNILISYYSIGFNDQQAQYFFVLCASMICTFFYGTSYGLLLSVIFNKMELVMALIPVLVIPFMVLGGFFINSNNIPHYFRWIEYVSMFKYGFQASALNEFEKINFTCEDQVSGKQCDPLDQLGINESMGTNFGAMIALGMGCRFFAYIMMHLISTPKRPKLNEKKQVKS